MLICKCGKELNTTSSCYITCSKCGAGWYYDYNTWKLVNEETQKALEEARNLIKG